MWRLVIVHGIFLAVIYNSIDHLSETFDEPIHLYSGIQYWHQRYKYNPENGNFPQRFAAIPFMISSYLNPEIKLPMNNNNTAFSNDFAEASSFFYEENRSYFREIFLHAKLIMLIFPLAIATLTYVETKSLIAMIMFCFQPIVLGLSPIIACDMAVSFFILSSGIVGDKYVKSLSNTMDIKKTLWNLLLLSVCVGGSVLSKHTGLITLPLLAIQFMSNAKRPTLKWVANVFISLALIGSIVFVLLWASYSFQSESNLELNNETAIVLRPFLKLLPPHYVRGIFHALSYLQRRSYFFGEYSTSRNVYFQPVGLLLKTPIGAVIYNTVGLILSLRSKAGFYNCSYLLVMVVLYSLWGILSPINLGVRHMLPILAPVIILASNGWNRVGGKWARPLLLLQIVLCGWTAYSSHSVHPNYISFFDRTLLCGNKYLPHEMFVDSNLDWGQGLVQVNNWINSRNFSPNESVFISYFGTASVKAYGFNATLLMGYPNQNPQSLLALASPAPGIYIFSSTMLVNLYLEKYWRTKRWDAELQREYMDLRKILKNAVSGTSMLSQVELNEAVKDFYLLRFISLTTAARNETPLDMLAGGSILIYRFNSTLVQNAVFGKQQNNNNEDYFLQENKYKQVPQLDHYT